MLSHCLRRADSADRTFHLIPLLGLILLLAAPLAAAAEPDSEEADEPAPPAGVVASDEADEPLPAHQVGQVTVTATRAERDVLEVAGNVTVIDREEIERSGVRTVPELLRRESGLFVTSTTTNPAGTQVEARGFNNGGALGSSMLVQINGRRANEADTGNTDWALISLDEVESIEIVRGPASALYGDNAVGGVINIRTRAAEGPPRATLRGRVGRYASGQGSLKAAGSFGPMTGSLFVDGLMTDGYRHGADFSKVDINGSLQGSFGERVVIGASGGRYWDERGLPGTLAQTEIDALGRRARDPGTEDERSEVESYFVNAWLEALLAEDVELRIQPSYRDRSDDWTTTYVPVGSLDTVADKLSFGVDTQVQVDRPLFGLRNRFIAGFDFLYEETDRNVTSGSIGRLSDSERSDYAGFLQDEVNLTDKLLLSAGFRFDRAEYELRVRDQESRLATDDPSFDVWSPKAAITYRFLPGLSAYFSYARGFRLPNFDENSPILSFDPDAPPTIPDLDPQISDSIEIGAKQRSERIDASLAFYYMDVRDEIIWDPLLSANMNFDRVRHIGVETAFAVQLLEWLSIYGSYTFEDVEIREAEDPDFEGRRMPITPKHRGTAGLLTELPYDLEFGVNANIVGERILSNDFNRELSKLDGYMTIDFLMAWRPTFGAHLEGALTFMLRNLAAEEFDDFGARSEWDPDWNPATTAYFYPAAKRTWEVGFMLTYRQ